MPVFLPVSVRIPATSANLGPGFDSLGLAFALYNELKLEISDADSLEVEGEGADQLQKSPQTIAHQAAHRVFQSLQLTITGVHLSLSNQIPLARGLGSSSAAIVGGIVAANEWARQNENRALSRQQLVDLATEIEGHPDNVAPALMGGLVVAAMGEEHIPAIQVPVSRFPRFSVWIPETELATKTARGVLPANYSCADAIFNLSRAALLVGALATGDFSALSEALRDKIHQDYRAPLVPGFAAISAAAQGAGAYGVTLSGAGPSILAWMPEESTPIVEAMRKAASDEGLKGRVLELEVDTQGCRISS
jgi:homoserine kinase